MLGPDDLLNRSVRLHDPAGGLEAVRELRGHLDRLEAIHVENALRGGWSWSEVARSLGLSKQAAHRKYAPAMRERLQHTGAPMSPEGRIVVAGTARLAVLLGRQEAEAMRRDAVGTEHVLLGLTRVEGTAAADALAVAGVTAEAARSAVEALAPDDPSGEPVRSTENGNGRLALTPQCRAALQGALQEALDLGSDHLGPEHLLLALLRDPRCGAVRALERLSVDPARVTGTLAAAA